MPQDYERQRDNHQPHITKYENCGYIHHDKRQIDRVPASGIDTGGCQFGNISCFVMRLFLYAMRYHHNGDSYGKEHTSYRYFG
jgi:hypothetical protein